MRVMKAPTSPGIENLELATIARVDTNIIAHRGKHIPLDKHTCVPHLKPMSKRLVVVAELPFPACAHHSMNLRSVAYTFFYERLQTVQAFRIAYRQDIFSISII